MRDEYLSSTQVCRRYGDITAMTLWRWQNDPRLRFPAPRYIGRRKFWPIAALEEWEKRHIRIPESGVSAKPEPEARKETADEEVSGLYLQKEPTGSESFVFRYRLSGRSIKQTLGTHVCKTRRRSQCISLREARLMASALNDLLAKLPVRKSPSR